MVEEQYKRAQDLLMHHREELEKLAQALLSQEVIVKSDLEKLIGPRPFDEPEKVRLAKKNDVEGTVPVTDIEEEDPESELS